MQWHFATAAERQSERCGNRGERAVTEAGRKFLELPDARVDLVKLAILRLHQQHREVRARREILALVADDQSRKMFRYGFHRVLRHANHVFAQCIGFAVKLEQGHAVTDIHEARSRHGFQDFRGIAFDIFEHDHAVSSAAGPIRVELCAARTVFSEDCRNAQASGLEFFADLFNAEQIHHLKRSEFPTEAPLQGVVHLAEIVRNRGHIVGGKPQQIEGRAPHELAVVTLEFQQCLQTFARRG